MININEQKTIRVNDIIECRYLIEDNRLYLKCRNSSIESLWAAVIAGIEMDTSVRIVSYLNVDIETGHTMR